MIEHLVFFKFKDDVGEDHIAKAIDAIKSLDGRIPEVVALTAGRNFTDRARGFQVGLSVRVKDKAGLAAYLAHPDHVAVVGQMFKPFIAELLALDYEV